MEPITHFLFGGVLARAGLNRTSALATTTLVLAAEAPDLDVLGNFGGRIFAFEHHRGITHTLAGAPFVAAFVVLLLWLWYRAWGARQWRPGKPPPRWGVLFGLAWLSCLGHILLDFTNSYGVRPFDPFAHRWYSWDTVFVAEPVLWAILLGGLLLPALFRLVTQEVRSGRVAAPRGRAGAIVALVLIAIFWGVRDFEHRRAIAAMEALTYRGQEPLRVSAYPYYINPFRWYGVVETRDYYVRQIVDSLTPEVDPDGRAMFRHKPQETPVTQAARQSYLGRVYLDWAAYPILEVEQLTPPDHGYLVRIYDLRFAYPDSRRRTPLGGWVHLDENLKVVRQNFGVRDIPGRSQRASLRK
ncbi:MAG: metal-dependent hydrolase [Terriglobales bacterium]